MSKCPWLKQEDETQSGGWGKTYPAALQGSKGDEEETHARFVGFWKQKVSSEMSPDDLGTINNHPEPTAPSLPFSEGRCSDTSPVPFWGD